MPRYVVVKESEEKDIIFSYISQKWLYLKKKIYMISP